MENIKCIKLMRLLSYSWYANPPWRSLAVIIHHDDNNNNIISSFVPFFLLEHAGHSSHYLGASSTYPHNTPDCFYLLKAIQCAGFLMNPHPYPTQSSPSSSSSLLLLFLLPPPPSSFNIHANLASTNRPPQWRVSYLPHRTPRISNSMLINVTEPRLFIRNLIHTLEMLSSN